MFMVGFEGCPLFLLTITGVIVFFCVCIVLEGRKVNEFQ